MLHVAPSSSARAYAAAVLLCLLTACLLASLSCSTGENPASPTETAASVPVEGDDTNLDQLARLQPQTLAVPPPREDQDAEILGWLIAGELTCPEYLYQIISRDLNAIRTVYGTEFPVLCSIRTSGTYDISRVGFVRLGVDTATHRQMRDGEYRYWSRLNEIYNPGISFMPNNNHDVLLLFRYNLHPGILFNLYRQLPGVVGGYASRTFIIWREIYARPTFKSDLTEFDFRTIAEAGMTYVFFRGDGDCLAGCGYHRWWLFRVDPDGSVISGDFWETAMDQKPEWWNEAMVIVDANWSWPPG